MAFNKYNNYGSGNGDSSSSGGDYEKDLSLKWKPHATFRGVLDRLNSADNQWGQSLGIKFTDGRLVDGVLMDRVGSDGEPDGTIKLFDWESMPVILDDSLSAEDAPEIYTEEFGGKTYRYQLNSARVEETEDPAEPIPFGDFMMWESGATAPSASSKTLAQTLTTKGRDIIVDRDDVNNWLDVDNVELREDLIGREVDVFKVTMQGDKHDFHRPILVDVVTETEINIANGSSAGSSSPEQATTDGGSAVEAVEDDGDDDVPGDLPAPVADFVDFCRKYNLTGEEQIFDTLEDLASDEDNSLTDEMIESVGRDEIVAAIEE